LVGSNFNNDGTALYEAMAALFTAQMTDVDLSAAQQLMVVLTSVVASVGAAGIPEAGLVTMTLVFSSMAADAVSRSNTISRSCPITGTRFSAISLRRKRLEEYYADER